MTPATVTPRTCAAGLPAGEEAGDSAATVMVPTAERAADRMAGRPAAQSCRAPPGRTASVTAPPARQAVSPTPGVIGESRYRFGPARRPTAAGRPPRADHDRVAAAARRLTPRDRLLCRTLFDHRVLTTEQVTDLCFDNLSTARHRLTALYGLRVLDRFRPFRPVGSDPYHYLLDTLGAEVVAAQRGIEIPRPGRHHSRSLALADNQRLAHLRATNGLFCALARWARSVEDAELAEWWPERRCATEWGEVVRPDGFGTLRQGDRVVELFVEVDRGTDTLARLADKLTGYAELVHATGWAPLVCFWFPSPGWEAAARRVLGHVEVRVATGAAGLPAPTAAPGARPRPARRARPAPRGPGHGGPRRAACTGCPVEV